MSIKYILEICTRMYHRLASNQPQIIKFKRAHVPHINMYNENGRFFALL